jgi:5'-nucleotidase
VRAEESKLGNFICDIVKTSIGADCTIINSGTLRSDCIFPPGEFKVGDLNRILMFPDPIVLLSCTGRILHEALENSVSKYPKLEGRFPLVAGIQFAFDPKQPAGMRIDPRIVKVKNEYLDLEKVYKLAVKSYLKEGKDGFQMLKNCPVLVSNNSVVIFER